MNTAQLETARALVALPGYWWPEGMGAWTAAGRHVRISRLCGAQPGDIPDLDDLLAAGCLRDLLGDMAGVVADDATAPEIAAALLALGRCPGGGE